MENVPFDGGDAVTGAKETNVRGPRGQHLRQNATLCSLPVSVGHETRKERDYRLVNALDWCHFANEGTELACVIVSPSKPEFSAIANSISMYAWQALPCRITCEKGSGLKSEVMSTSTELTS